jgi:hypothetical protein
LYRTAQSLIAWIMVFHLSVLMAASPVIGVAMARGDFSIDNAKVAKNATLFEGNTIDAGQVSPKLQLNSGAQIQLASGSRGQVYHDHMILERGAGQFEALRDYRIEALSLHIAPAAPNSTARVTLQGRNTVHVAALNGALRVANAEGIVVANITAGRALEFTPQQAGAAAPTTMTGCLEKRNDRYLLKDETSNVTVELQGPGVEKEVGNRIEITGTMVPGASVMAPATQLIRVTNLRRISRKCSLPAGALPGAAAAGLSTAAKVVIASVIVAGAGIGTGIGLTRGGEETPPSPSQR